MTATIQYAVRINARDGALEVTGPDKDWVDAKIEQLRSVVSAFSPSADSGEAGRKSARKRRPAEKGRDDPGTGDTNAAPPRRTKSSGGKSQVNEALKDRLTPEVRKAFNAYVTERRKAWDGSQSAQAAIIATFLSDELGTSGIDQSDLYTVYTVMGERSPANIRSQLTNARQRARYFSGLVDGKMVLSHAGENYARFDSKNAESGKDES